MEPRLSTLTAAYESSERARALVQWALALALGGSVLDAWPIFERTVSRAIFETYQKAATAAISGVANADLATAKLATDFLAIGAKQRLVGQLLALGALPIPSFAPAPLVSSGATADFVAEGAPTPATWLATTAVMTGAEKLALILGIAKDFLLSTDGRTVALLERHLQRAVREAEGRGLLSSDAAVAGERPAGLLAGLSAVGAGSPGGIDDIPQLWNEVRSGEPDRPLFITSSQGVVYLATLNINGQPQFPNVRIDGTGDIFGVPLLVNPAANAKLILLDVAALGIADNGLIIDTSRYATIEMDSAPVGGAGAVYTSAFQSNLSFIRIRRFVSWVLGYSDGVAFMSLPVAGSGSPA